MIKSELTFLRKIGATFLLYNLKMRNENQKETYYSIFAWGLLIFFVLMFCLDTFNLGTRNINSIFAKRDFDFQGYVYAFPDSNDDKNYRLKADISKNHNEYRVNRIYFKNGGYIDFKDHDSDPIYKNTGQCGDSVTDDEDNDWCFIFYGEQVQNNTNSKLQSIPLQKN